MYNVDFDDIAKKLIPLRLRKVKALDYLSAILKPLKSLHADFLSFVNTKKYELKFTGQIIYLEHLLNDTYDSTTRGIYIVDTANIDLTYWFNRGELTSFYYLRNRSEGQPPKYLKNRIEYINHIHFIIKVPSGVSFVEVQMRTLIDKYLQAGKNYTIEII
jgi:hypothetical protein